MKLIGKPHDPATPEQIAAMRALISERVKGDPKGLFQTYACRQLFTDYTLHRFITARNGNVDVAFQALSQHLEWRQSYQFDDILNEDFSDMESVNEMFYQGLDLKGHPILVWRLSKHDPKFCAKDRMVRFFIYMLEKGMQTFAPAEQLVFVVDCRGMKKKNIDIQMIKLAVPIVENNFPERQYATYVIPVGTLITLAWKVIAGFLDPGTAYKIRLLGGYDSPMISQFFGQDIIQALEEGVPSFNMSETEDDVPSDNDEMEISLSTKQRRANRRSKEMDSSKEEIILFSDSSVADTGFDADGESQKSGSDNSVNIKMKLKKDRKTKQQRPHRTRRVSEVKSQRQISDSDGYSSSIGKTPGDPALQQALDGLDFGCSVSPLSDQRSGILLKQRNRIRKYRERFFVLEPASGKRPSQLTYYQSKWNRNSPKTFYLEGCEVMLESSRDSKLQPFTVTTAKKEVLNLAAHSPDAAFEWVAAIASASIPEAQNQQWKKLQYQGENSQLFPNDGKEQELMEVLGNEALSQELRALRDWQQRTTNLLDSKEASYQELMVKYQKLLAVSSATLTSENSFDEGPSSDPWLNPKGITATPRSTAIDTGDASEQAWDDDTSALKTPISPASLMNELKKEQSHTSSTGSEGNRADRNNTQNIDLSQNTSEKSSLRSLLGRRHQKRQLAMSPIKQDLAFLKVKSAQLEVDNLVFREATSTLSNQLKQKQSELASLSALFEEQRQLAGEREAFLSRNVSKLREENSRLRSQAMQLEAQVAGLEMERDAWKNSTNISRHRRRRAAPKLPVQEPKVLNRSKIWVSKARPAVELVDSLHQQLEHLVQTCAAQQSISYSRSSEHDLKSSEAELDCSSRLFKRLSSSQLMEAPDLDEIRNLPEYQDLVLDSAELQQINLRSVPRRQRRNFFLQLYRLLSMHASIDLNVPEEDVDNELSTLIAYDIGGSLMTAADMKSRAGTK